MMIIEGKLSYEELEYWYRSSCEYIKNLEDNEQRMGSELHYLYSYLSWKNLSDEFRYFRENAREEHDSDSPFPILTL